MLTLNSQRLGFFNPHALPQFPTEFPEAIVKGTQDVIDPFLKHYAQGAGLRTARLVAEFLAPTVPVAQPIGRYRKYRPGLHFFVADTGRAFGGAAEILKLVGSLEQYDCRPRALDVPIDRADDSMPRIIAFMDALGLSTDIAGMSHEQRTIALALASTGAGTDVTFTGADDPVRYIDTQILQLIMAGYSQEIGILFGATAWDGFKHHPAVKAYCANGVGYISTPQLFHADAPYMPCYTFVDRNQCGMVPDVQFLMTNEVLLFSRSSTPTRSDPSFMKTFRLHSSLLGSGRYTSADGRKDVSKFDWSEDIRVCNEAGFIRLNMAFE